MNPRRDLSRGAHYCYSLPRGMRAKKESTHGESLAVHIYATTRSTPLQQPNSFPGGPKTIRLSQKRKAILMASHTSLNTPKRAVSASPAPRPTTPPIDKGGSLASEASQRPLDASGERARVAQPRPSGSASISKEMAPIKLSHGMNKMKVISSLSYPGC